ncbi:hypothetical protein DES53_11495 [Roseimicrobium gellanilyticum]|uniref:Uncharacterized protein n=1 Tax=Roseimicrobium gellanilyticum TaxID=748857 RepID=A0A366H5L2_9BACT|nr:hypothetical protein [Roseimicrobium gellanilyticum]RBP37357.1 hypothetical protein DES53_11495 [Roseimicrobium gellanilyticum]
MDDLPSIPALIQRTKALAALDLIMSPEWAFRYFSFNCTWAAGEQMASMRDGSGDDWSLVFHKDGWSGLKGLTHESDAWSEGGAELSAALQSVIPPTLRTFASEYYEVEIPLKVVTKIYTLAPITREMVKSLNPAITLKDIQAELRDGIGYPV